MTEEKGLSSDVADKIGEYVKHKALQKQPRRRYPASQEQTQKKSDDYQERPVKKHAGDVEVVVDHYYLRPEVGLKQRKESPSPRCCWSSQKTCRDAVENVPEQTRQDVNCVVGDTPKALDNFMRNCTCTPEWCMKGAQLVRARGGDVILRHTLPPGSSFSECPTSYTLRKNPD
ncbi:hypothetical protein P692DRAFT_20823001 [Suillus brevipes Sb2]|nr:hypothetical protein P692DRAFT_20823001 [Suillus brevipes Sb2]